MWKKQVYRVLLGFLVLQKVKVESLPLLYSCALRSLLSQEYLVKPDSKVCRQDFGKEPVWESLMDAADWWVKPCLFTNCIFNFFNLHPWILSPNFQNKPRTDLWSVLPARTIICHSPVHDSILAAAACSSVWAMCQIPSLGEESAAWLEHCVTFATSLAIFRLASLKIARTCPH